MLENKPVIVNGCTVIDVVMYMDHLPGYQQDVNLKRQEMRVGGCAFNVMRTIRALEVPYVFNSVVGDGVYGEFIRSYLVNEKIEYHFDQTGEHGCCYCLIDEHKDRTFISNHGIEYGFDKAGVEALGLPEGCLTYFCGLEVEERNGDDIVAFVKEHDVKVCFAPGPRFDHIPVNRMEAMLDHTYLLHINEEEAYRLSGKSSIHEALVALQKRTGGIVIVTEGAKGAHYISADGVGFVPSFSCEIKDTVGAGDSHCGGVLAGLALGYDLNKAVKLGNYAAMCVLSERPVERI